MRSTLISSVCTAVLLVCASVRADLSTPVTPLQFKASYTLSESASIGATNAIGDIGNLATTALAASNDALTSALGGLFGGAGITIGGGANINGGPSKLHGRSVSDLSFGLTVTGTVFYDYINRRMRTDTNVGSSTQTELLLFDLNKNYTWFGNSGCTCGQIEEEYTDMPIYFVPPESPSTFAQADITVNGQNVNAKLYAATIDLPAIGSVVQQFYVNNLNQLIRQKSEVSIAGLASVSTQVDFYNIVGLPSDTSFAPLASCRCASDIPVAGSTFTNTFASTCNAPAEACKCPATVQADITFCRDIVTYPIQSTVCILMTFLFLLFLCTTASYYLLYLSIYLSLIFN
eukprot:TRINITY_DN4000_c0_g1_i8.p1 TRINITY_DN4000_c0_g1~~TRINITY_DN4000_c0_g1_i8.p1  ORF type:complete len:346 (-),score=73.07 TRINITY_DN4000_c0_g1_i8:462-1499(-)